MNLLFISMTAQIIIDTEGNKYLNAHMNENVIKRYSDLCDNFRMILRESNIRCSREVAKYKYNIFPENLAELVICYNPYNPIQNLLRLDKRIKTEKIIKENVEWADKIILASASGVYTNDAIKWCKRLNKKYMILNGGFSFETDWNHGFDGKLVAFKRERETKKNIYEAPYVLYVTKQALQNRYPCNGKTIGCSDVELHPTATSINSLEKRLNKINTQKKNSVLIIGTAAAIDWKLKGHRYVIQALSLLKKEGYDNYRYEVIGNGSDLYIKNLAKKYDVEDMIYVKGAIPHNQVYEWYDSIDIYVQPSIVEGLCRSLVEAMSCSLPIICTNVGGNVELASKEYLVEPQNAVAIKNAILKISKNQVIEAKRSFEKSKEYNFEVLDNERNKFLNEFMKG